MMKSLLVVLSLLLCGQLWAADPTVASTRCWDGGPYVATADHGTKCPPQLTSASATTPTTTSFIFNTTAVTSSGTIYIYVSTTNVAPSRKALISGEDAAYSGTITVSSTGLQTKTITPLLPSTEYFLFARHFSTSGRPGNTVTANMQTNSESTPPTYMVLEGKFICANGGSDSNSGDSYEQCWATTAPWNATAFTAGTDLWIEEGAVIGTAADGYPGLITKHGGLSGNHSYIGGFYRFNGTNYAIWEGPSGGLLDFTDESPETVGTTHTLPMFKGTLTDLCVKSQNTFTGGYSTGDTPNCTFPWPDPTPDCSSLYDAQVQIKHDYVTLRGIRIGYSACQSLKLFSINAPTTGGARVQEGLLNHVHVMDVYLHTSAFGAMESARGVRYNVYKRIVSREDGRCQDDAKRGGQTATWGGPKCSGSPSPGVTVQISERAYTLYEQIGIYDSFGENLACKASSALLWRGNRIMSDTAFARTQIYPDQCPHSIYESNIFLDNPNRGNTGTNYAAPSVGFESYPISGATQAYNTDSPWTGLVFRNNIFGKGLGTSGVEAGGCTTTNGVTTCTGLVNLDPDPTWEIHFIHNTILPTTGRDIHLPSSHDQFLVSSPAITSRLQNNLFASTAPQISADQCATKFLEGYNAWVKAPTDTDCTATTDMGGEFNNSDVQLALPVGTAASPNAANIAAYLALDPSGSASAAADATGWLDIDNVLPSAAGTAMANPLYAEDCGITAAEKLEWKKVLPYAEHPFRYDVDSSCVGNESDSTCISDQEVDRFAACAFYDFDGTPRSTTTPRAGALE